MFLRVHVCFEFFFFPNGAKIFPFPCPPKMTLIQTFDPWQEPYVLYIRTFDP